MLKGLRQKAPNAPHENFWKDLDYAEFVAFAFPLKYGKPGSIKLLVPYDSKSSNMIKAFRDGKGVTLDMPDGSTKVVDINPMPKDADPMDPADIQKLCDWIDAGCPEFAGKPSALPRPGSGKAPAAGTTKPPAKAEPKKAPPADDGGGFPAPKDGGGGFPPPGGGG